MSDIPEAYLEKARLVISSAHPQENLAHVIARALMEAVEAERERCARIVERRSQECNTDYGDPTDYGYRDACEEIIASIRDRAGKNE